MDPVCVTAGKVMVGLNHGWLGGAGRQRAVCGLEEVDPGGSSLCWDCKYPGPKSYRAFKGQNQHIKLGPEMNWQLVGQLKKQPDNVKSHACGD